MSKRLEVMVTTGTLAGKRYAVPEGGLRLGRSSSNDLHLPDEELSRNHCLFEPDGESAIRVIDLASANGTFVNGEQLGAEPRVLAVGDVISVGSSELQVVGDGEPPPVPPVTASKPAVAKPVVTGGIVDLGLGPAKPEPGASESAPAPASPAASRRKIMNLLWAGVAVCLVTAIILLLTKEDFARKVIHPDKKSVVDVKAPATIDIPLSLLYERVDATPAKIIRYQVVVTGDVLELVYDAQAAAQTDSQKVEEHGNLKDSSKKRLDEIFDSAEWLGLSSVSGDSVMSLNTLKRWRLKLVRNGQVKEVVVENTTLPAEFRTICEDLETLVNNDLGVTLSLRSPEECLASSKKHEELGDDLLEKEEVKEENLWEGIKSLKRARNELKGLAAFYEDQNRLQQKIEAAEARLKTRYDEVYGRGERARQIEDWTAARDAYQEIRALIPDTTDPRGADAEAKLRDIEVRLEEANRKGKRK